MKISSEERLIQLDRMRYTKNKMAANLVLLAIITDVFYFVSIYKTDVGSYYYTILTGSSVIYNLVFMLIAFLSSEGIKNYKNQYSYVLAFLGLLQFVRIFIIPVKAHSTMVLIGSTEVKAMEDGQFARCIIYLCLSGLSLIASAAVGYIRSKKLSEYLNSLEPEERRD